MDVFHVVFDTSVLRKEHFRHALFEKLLGLSQRGLVKIYIPHVVLEELRTQWIATVFNAIDAINSNLEHLRSSSSQMHLEGLSQPVAEIWTKEEVERNSRSAFERFVAKNKIERLHMTLEQAEGMWNRYFSCLPPFDSPILDICREMVKVVPEHSPEWSELAAAIQTTGVVMGELGLANAYERKLNEIAAWKQDDDVRVRSFAQWISTSLERSIEHEKKRAEESLALRKYKYGTGPAA